MSNLKDEARKLYQARRYSDAIRQYRILADQGDSTAQLMLGQLHAEGLGTQKDLEEANKWYTAAAGRGSVEAQHYLGYEAYRKKDYATAMRWYEQAASRRYLPAMWRLAWLYRQGKSGPIAKGKAYQLFEDAARCGHVFAKRDLGVMLLRGQRGPSQIFRGIALLVQCVVEGIRLFQNHTLMKGLGYDHY